MALNTSAGVAGITARWGDMVLEEEEALAFEPVEGWSICVVRSWRLSATGKGVQITEVQLNLFMFIFYHKTDMEYVLEEGPWSFEGKTLVCRQLAEGVLPADVVLDSVDLWVQVHDLPLGYSLSQYWNKLEILLARSLSWTIDSLALRGKLSTVSESLYRAQPLKRRMKLLKRDKTTCWVNFKYERLHTFCFFCGLLHY
ncbi:PREDICTED: uncharacterized protein LOC109169822 [Ipomoea nil]|uniref:uncharacterized protein LOC109169822 n=1 Tax=Ipomoea nil TaxID=35883 RepID=UPI0009019BFE|nr:PREDICTED: uncharacterized protein LOC109169822 [Ipomoea nil]